jgi:hypothetical protein
MHVLLVVVKKTFKTSVFCCYAHEIKSKSQNATVIFLVNFMWSVNVPSSSSAF